MAMTGINYDDLNNYLYTSENYGKDWKRMRGNLPNEPVNIITEDKIHEDILYAGMYRGVYISVDRGKSWNILGKDFPMSSVSDIEIEERSNDMIVSTHGRGIYKINLDPIHKFYKYKNKSSIDNLLSVEKMILPKFNDTHGEPIPESYEKVPISFYLNGNKKYSLEIRDKEKVIWEKTGYGYKGLNQFRWDLVIESSDDQSPYFIHYNKYISRGEYDLYLKTDNNIDKVKISVNGQG